MKLNERIGSILFKKDKLTGSYYREIQWYGGIVYTFWVDAEAYKKFGEEWAQNAAQRFYMKKIKGNG
jgi:hypothetical protein